MADPLAGIRRALVIGTGASGLAAARALAAAGVAVRLVDEATSAPQAAGLAAPIEVLLGADPLVHLDGVDLVVPSPGVPEHAPVLVAAARRETPIWSEPELGIRLAPRRLVAITGTNGKTSVTELVTAILRAAGQDAVACGNIGTPVTVAAAEAAPTAVLVAELSSFQLRYCWELAPEVGVLLNLAPDHLDWHGGLEAYGDAKARVWRAQTDGQWAVANADDDHAAGLLATAPAGRAVFSTGGVPAVGVGLDGGRIVASLEVFRGTVLDVADLPVQAPHHVANVAAAATAALLLGAAPEVIAGTAAEFSPGRHRVQLVVSIAGVDFVDDSKATNAHAAAAALASFPSIVWIAGGIAKGVDLAVLGEHVGAVRHAVLIGEAARALAAVCDRRGIPNERVDSIELAVAHAAAAAAAGDTVLLAPACSSFDMFHDYADRGDRFAAAARALADPRGAR